MIPPELSYIRQPDRILSNGDLQVSSFVKGAGPHVDHATVHSFGEEWEKFDRFSEQDIKEGGDQYFDIVPKETLLNAIQVLDLGCGSGRWTRYMSPLVGRIEAVDPNQNILNVALVNRDLDNARFSQAGVGDIPFENGSFDLIVCLGVLHHVPNTAEALQRAALKLRKGGHFLLYLYYALDGRGPLFKMLFHLSTVFRRIISRMPGKMKRVICDLIAIFVYLPFVGLNKLVGAFNAKAGAKMPLSYYGDKSFRWMRTDALDRFGTPLEKRFTKAEIRDMMVNAGLTDLKFSEHMPYWHAFGTKT